MIRNFLQGRAIKHPLHPMMVHLPIGLWVTSFIFDIVYLINGSSLMAGASYYCMLVGTIAAGLAAITGLAEFISIPRDTHTKRLATIHMILNVTVTVCYIINLYFRHRLEGATPTLITGGQFIFSLILIVLLSASGYIGGLLVYNYGIGFKPQLRAEERAREPEEPGRAA